MVSKKVAKLARKLQREKEALEEASEKTKWFYELQVRLAKADLEDAMRAENKRIMRRNFKRLMKANEEIKKMRADLQKLFHPKGYGYNYDDAQEVIEEMRREYGYNEFKEIVWGS